MYFNEENLRRAYRRPGRNLIDFIRAASRKPQDQASRRGANGEFPGVAGRQVADAAAGAVSVAAQEPWHRPRSDRARGSLPAAAVDPERG